MNKIIIIAVFIFWGAVSIFFVNSLVRQNNGSLTNLGNLLTNNPANIAPVTYTLTTAIVTQHNMASDCWVTAGNNVYNVTSYIKSHPGGQSNIIKYCGGDIAAAFATQGHSANASNILASYKIGIIGSTVSTDAVAIPPANTNQNTNVVGNDDEEEDD
ncbi:MAG: cytochrome b5-like heme/steroid binding domain-containing protein [Patescibacteria group bacterium]|jgi:cytochrome b involved in lipid metabolism